MIVAATDEQVKLAQECWARDLSYSEAYNLIKQRTGSDMTLFDIGTVYSYQEAEFAQWCMFEERRAQQSGRKLPGGA